jgi:uncharacterized protein with GYD domain
MQTFVMLTRLDRAAVQSPQSFEELERRVMDRIKHSDLKVKWLASYAVLGPYDYVDVFEAADNEAAMRVSLLFRTHGHAHTEIWGATAWPRFKDLLHRSDVIRP